MFGRCADLDGFEGSNDSTAVALELLRRSRADEVHSELSSLGAQATDAGKRLGKWRACDSPSAPVGLPP